MGGVALHNARLHAEARRALARATTLLDATRALSDSLDLTETLRCLARAAARAVGADMVGSYLADPDGSALRPAAGYHVPAALRAAFREVPMPLRGHAFLEEAWRDGRPVWTADSGSDPRADRGFVERFAHRSVLVVPMPGPGEPIGALVCVWWQAHPRPAADEVSLLEAIASQGAVAVRNARLHAAALAATPPPPA